MPIHYPGLTAMHPSIARLARRSGGLRTATLNGATGFTYGAGDRGLDRRGLERVGRFRSA